MAKLLAADTDEGTERVYIEMLRAAPDWKKFQMVIGLTNAARQMALAGLRARYPQASEGELHKRLAALIFDRETVRRAYGWDSEVEGY